MINGIFRKVRLDYRNPSAHRDKVTITSAKNCIEYVIDVHHMLKEMLGTMKISRMFLMQMRCPDQHYQRYFTCSRLVEELENILTR